MRETFESERMTYHQLPREWQKQAVWDAVDGYQTIEDENETGVTITPNDPCVMEYVLDHIYYIETDEFGRQTLCKDLTFL